MIHVVVNRVAGGWSPDAPLSWGGSEEAVVRLAEALVRGGQPVTVWQNGSPVDSHNGVAYAPLENMGGWGERDVLIGFKTPELFGTPRAAETKILWTADPGNVDGLRVDRVVAISRFHKKEILSASPGTPEDGVTVIPLGIPAELQSKAIPIKRSPHRVIYASSFDRGLESLLGIWPRIRGLVDDAELHIYYGWELFDKVCAKTPGAEEFKARLSAQIAATPGVVFHGRVPENDLEDAFREAAIWAYPCTGGERFCLTAVKAQVLGAVPVVVPAMALDETVRHGRKVDAERFEQALVSALQDVAWQEEKRAAMVADKNLAVTWDEVATRFTGLWADRRPRKVLGAGLKILVISSTIFKVPLAAYGGLEQIAYWCAEEFAKRGHEVSLVAPEGSLPPPGVELIAVKTGEFEGEAFKKYEGRLNAFDVVVDHSWFKFSYVHKRDRNNALKVIGICHAPIETMYGSPPPVAKPCLVGLSKDHARRISRHLKVNTRHVYNGIDLLFYAPRPEWKRDGRYLFMGRMSTIKGPHVAVDVAARAGVGLDLVGDDGFTQEPGYASQLKQSCTGDIKYWGGVAREKTVELYSTRKALLNTILWDAEPFGLVMVEAMACGMPVFTFDRGSPKEIVIHGKTGFVVDSPEEMLELVKGGAAETIDPVACRARAEEFSKERMGAEYLKLCEAVVAGEEW